MAVGPGRGPRSGRDPATRGACRRLRALGSPRRRRGAGRVPPVSCRSARPRHPPARKRRVITAPAGSPLRQVRREHSLFTRARTRVWGRTSPGSASRRELRATPRSSTSVRACQRRRSRRAHGLVGRSCPRARLALAQVSREYPARPARLADEPSLGSGHPRLGDPPRPAEPVKGVPVRSTRSPSARAR